MNIVSRFETLKKKKIFSKIRSCLLKIGQHLKVNISIKYLSLATIVKIPLTFILQWHYKTVCRTIRASCNQEIQLKGTNL